MAAPGGEKTFSLIRLRDADNAVGTPDRPRSRNGDQSFHSPGVLQAAPKRT